MKTPIIKVNPEFPEKDKIAHCAKIIRQGGLVIFPTETVYGIAADYNNEKAMARLRRVKQREEGKPFSIHVSQKGLIANYSYVSNPSVYKMIDEYWPGPLTVVVPAHSHRGTVGIRMPQHAIALSLVEESQCSVAAPSANLSGRPPPSTCHEALKDLDGLVDLAIDGGSAHFGQASSVVDFTGERPTVIRDGVITQADVDRVTQRKTILFVCTGNSCRSVMAEYLLKNLLKERGDVEVISAGTSVFLRASASAETVIALQKLGIDASLHQSQPINSIMLRKADLILVMTRQHRQQALDRVPEVEKRVYLLKEFASEPVGNDYNMDIPDPMGKPPEAYESCLMTVKDAVAKIAKLV